MYILIRYIIIYIDQESILWTRYSVYTCSMTTTTTDDWIHVHDSPEQTFLYISLNYGSSMASYDTLEQWRRFYTTPACGMYEYTVRIVLPNAGALPSGTQLLRMEWIRWFDTRWSIREWNRHMVRCTLDIILRHHRTRLVCNNARVIYTIERPPVGETVYVRTGTVRMITYSQVHGYSIGTSTIMS